MTRFQRVETALVLACALLSILFYARLSAAFPSADDERAVRDRIGARGQPGEAVLLAPHWAERARLFGLGLPVLNLSRGATPEDLAGFSGLFVLSFDDLPRADRQATLDLVQRAGFEAVGPIEPFGRLSLAHFRQTSPREVTFRATDALARADAFIETPQEGRRPCRRGTEGLRCKGARHAALIQGQIREIGFKPHRCVTFAPVGQSPLAIEFGDVPLGATLDLLAGPIGQGNLRRRKRAPIAFSATIDGRPTITWRWLPGEAAERRASIDTRDLREGTHTLRFEVTGDERQQIEFCFEAEAWR